MTVPAWWLDGHSAHGAGFVGVVTADRKRRTPVYTVTPKRYRDRGDGPLADVVAPDMPWSKD
ncbi:MULTISPECIES: hypothetical protein [Nocardia]|uniref:hypothetical protein n=1 Tax=Nocardia TaxID=1817 RepID=UPI0018941277|nr:MULTISPECIES: hypothetical protein [Nocardia]MBF6350151.1 hypothetical protein [Nocardia flavorosea]